MLKVGRLSRLATLLENETAKSLGLKFNLETWGDYDIEHTGVLFWKKENICQTTACAVGLACLSGEFKADNLKYARNGLGNIYPIYAEDDRWDAVEAFFGLTEKEAIDLFYEDSYDGPVSGPLAEKAGAKRIRALIAKKTEGKETGDPQPTKKAVEKIKREALKVAV